MKLSFSLKQIKKRFVFLIFIFYALNNTIFERQYFFNEVLSAIGFAVFLKICLKRNGILFFPKNEITRLLAFFWALCILYIFISVLFKTNWYFYFRHWSIFYSTFIFFIGFFWKDEFLKFMQKIRKWLTGIILYFIPAYPPYYMGRVLDRYSAAVFFPFFFKKINSSKYLILLLLNILYAYFFQSLTGTLIAIIIFVVLTLPSYAYFRLLFLVSLVSFLMLFISQIPHFVKYKEGSAGNHLFGNLSYVYRDSKILQIDPNSSWRMVYWYRVVVEKFPENLLGIGFGTPYLPYVEGRDTADSNYDDKHDAHTTGAHNIYVTIFVRLGIGVLFFFFALYTAILKEFYRFKFYYLKNNHIIFFIGFFTISIIGLFNPTLETPTYSGVYWFFLGLVAKSIHERRLTNENPAST